MIVVPAHSHHVVRHGLHRPLDYRADLGGVGQASDGVETCRLVERLQPDDLVADTMMGALHE